MRIAFFEDRAAPAPTLGLGLGPIALMRPVFELLCGQFSLRERVVRRFDVSDWGAYVRSELADTYRETHPEASVNDRAWLDSAPTLLINGRWLPSNDDLAGIRSDEVGVVDDTVVFLTLDPIETPFLFDDDWSDALSTLARSRRLVRTAGRLVRRPWDLVNHNGQQLREDFRLRRFPAPQEDLGVHVALLGSPEDLFVDVSARIDPFVVFDVRSGPISIDAGAQIGSFTQIEGPCHVGQAAQLVRAHVRPATTIGPHCRVGGEIEACLLHGYVNKYHTGFLGHSYVCPWVNLGALTTNSDLKNDYSSVRVPLGDELVDTGEQKVGCFIGDHTKTALASPLNTGTSVGLFCMLLPAGGLLPKHIPSYARVWHGALEEIPDVESVLETARATMARRNRELTPAQVQLARTLMDQTASEREEAVRRFREKRAVRGDAVRAL